MQIEDFDYSPLEGELAAIVRAMLQRNGGRMTFSPDELPLGLYTIDVEHTEDGGIVVLLHEHGTRMQ